MHSNDGPLVLGVETSCDETGVGIVRGHTLLADAVASSVDEHARFGGVVPEVASRAHLEAMVPTIERACDTAGVKLHEVDAIAVTSGPGLAGALLVGVAAAKALSVALGKPIYGVNHLAAHVAVDQLEHGPLPEPCVAMLVSGGHSSLLKVEDVTTGVDPLGATIDDAAGEAFDKIARFMGLPFPGGPEIDRLATEGDPAAIDRLLPEMPRAGLPIDMADQKLIRDRIDMVFAGPDAARRCMMVLVGMSDPGLVIWPTHRVLGGMQDYSIERFLNAAKETGLLKVRELGNNLTKMEPALLEAKEPNTVGIFDYETKLCYLATPGNADPLAKRFPDKPRG